MTNTLLQNNNRIYVLDYIKGIAMISVIMNHSALTSLMEHILLYPFFIGLAVPFFILVSGFTFALSFHKKESLGIGHWYKKETLLPKLSRFLAPFIFIYLLEMIYRYGYLGLTFDMGTTIQYFIFGGYGPGGYYVPVLIQMLFIFPICYWVIKKYGFKGVLVLAVIQLIYQIGVYNIDLDNIYYKRIILRYLVFLAGGIYIFLHKDDILKPRLNRKLLVLSLIAGVIYIFIVNYLGYIPSIFTSWSRTAMPTILFVFPVMAYFISTYLYKKIPNKFGDFIALIGKGSYHIFLVQMLWFHIAWEATLPKYISVPLNLVLTITLGLLFFKCENAIRERLKRNTNKEQIIAK